MFPESENNFAYITLTDENANKNYWLLKIIKMRASTICVSNVFFFNALYKLDFAFFFVKPDSDPFFRSFL